MNNQIFPVRRPTQQTQQQEESLIRGFFIQGDVYDPLNEEEYRLEKSRYSFHLFWEVVSAMLIILIILAAVLGFVGFGLLSMASPAVVKEAIEALRVVF